MTSTRRATKRVRRRLTEYDNVHASDIDITFREDPVLSTIDFYFESLNDGSEDMVPALDEWRRSRIVVMDGRIVEWTLHLPMIHPPFDIDKIEDTWNQAYKEEERDVPVIFYVSEYEDIGIPHIDTPERVWDNEDVNFSVATFFDSFDAAVLDFADSVYDYQMFNRKEFDR